jgi:hypothetical protein
MTKKRIYTVSAAVIEKNRAAGKARHPEAAQDWTSVRVPRRVAEAARRKAKADEPLWKVIERVLTGKGAI